MKYLMFMNYTMLVAICGYMGIIASDFCWLLLDFLGVFALIISCCYEKKAGGKDD